MAKARKRSGPTITDPPHVLKIRERLAERGCDSLKDAAQRGGFGYSAFVRMIHHGIADDPKQSTVDRLKDLGIYDLVRKRDSA